MDSDSYNPVHSDDEKRDNDNVLDGPVDEEKEAEKRLVGNNENESKAMLNIHDNRPEKKDPMIIIHDSKPEFSGMNKEELMRYVNDPFWVTLRWILFILFWVAWIAMIVGAIVIVVLAPRCAPPPVRDWWQKGPMYQVYVRSFMDSNGDGNGDLRGLTDKLDYIKDLGVNTVILSSIYESPNVDGGYDVTNYVDINDIYGNMTDFDNLMSEIKSKDLQLVLDFVPNHSSKNHRWFEISSDSSHPEYDKYKDYYVWADGDSESGTEPNNWRNVYYKSAWARSSAGGNKFYLHKFLPSQPDLNLRNPDVRAELTNVLEFWLEKGVHGFRINAITHLFEDIQLENEAKNEQSEVEDIDEYDYWDHTKTEFQPEIFELLQEWRSVLNNYSTVENPRIFMSDSGESLDRLIQYYGNENATTLIDMPMNMNLSKLESDITGYMLQDMIKPYNTTLGEKYWPNWQLGSRNTRRVGSKMSDEMVDLMNILVMFLKGTPITYYGEEIGMKDIEISGNQVKDGVTLFELAKNKKEVEYRDQYRAPMVWRNSSKVGFTDGEPWLPVSKEKMNNVQDELKDSKSHLNIYKQAAKLRAEDALLFGIMKFPVVTNETFSVLRHLKGVPGYLMAMNVGEKDAVIDLKHDYLPKTALTHFVTSNAATESFAEKGSIVTLSGLKLRPKQCIVMTFIPK